MLPGDWVSIDSKHSIPGKAHKIDFAQCKRQGRAGQGKGRARAGQGRAAEKCMPSEIMTEASVPKISLHFLS